MPATALPTAVAFYSEKTGNETWRTESMARRKDLKSPWECSWECGFVDYDIAKVSEHEKICH